MHANVVSDTVVDVLGILRAEYETVFGPVRDECVEQSATSRADLDAERARLEWALRADELALVELRGGALAAQRRAAALALERSELRGMLAELAHCVCSELRAVTSAP